MLEPQAGILARKGEKPTDAADLEKALGRRWLHRDYFHRAHLFDFTPWTLEAFLRRSGFQPLARRHAADAPPHDKNFMILARKADPDPSFAPEDPARAADLLQRLRARHDPTLWRRLLARFGK